MKRRGFLKRLGVGAVSAPAIVKTIGDQKSKAYHDHIPEIKPYNSTPTEHIAGCCMATCTDYDLMFFPIQSINERTRFEPINDWKGLTKWQR